MNDTRNDTSQSLESLAELWQVAKAAEATARDERVSIEEQIIALTGMKEEGSQTHKAGNRKIKVVAKLTRKLLPEEWERIAKDIPEALHPVQYKPSLDLKGLRYLEANEPKTYALVCQAIETKPAKPAVEVV